MTLLGFASYLCAVAALVVTLTVWLELLWAVDTADRRALWLEAAVACLTPLLFVAHGHAFAIFLALAGISAVATGRRWARILRLRALGPALALAGWVAWSQRASVIPPGSAPPPNPPLEPHFQGLYDKLSLLVTPTLLTRTGADVVVGLVLWAILLAAVIATSRATAGEASSTAPFAHVRALVACMAGLFAAFLGMPHTIGWFGFVDGRLVLVLLLLAVMTVRKNVLRPPLAGLYARVAPAAAWTMTAIAIGASWLFQREARGWRQVLAHVPAESRLLNLPLEPDSRIFTAHPFVHYDKFALAERPIVVSDVWFHQGSALYPTPENPALRLPPSYSESDLRFIDWPAYRMDDWDYVLIRTRPESLEPPVPASVKLAAHEGGWWLFQTH